MFGKGKIRPNRSPNVGEETHDEQSHPAQALGSFSLQTHLQSIV